MKHVYDSLYLIVILGYFFAVVFQYKVFYIGVVLLLYLLVLMVLVDGLKLSKMLQDISILLLLFSYFLLTSLWAKYPQETLKGVAIHSIFILLWIVTYQWARRRSLFQLSFLFECLPYVVAALFLYISIRYGTLRPYDRESSLAVGAVANNAGNALSTTLPFLIWRFKEGRKRDIFTLVLSIILIAVSQSRTAYILTMFSIMVALYVYKKSIAQYFINILKFAIIILTLCGVVVFLPPVRKSIIDGFDRMTKTYASLSSFSETGYIEGPDIERKLMFDKSVEAFLEKPFFGIGYNNLRMFMDEDYGFGLVSHNLMITLLSEAGFPALLLFLFLIVRYFGVLRRSIAMYRYINETKRKFYVICGVVMTALLLESMFHPFFGKPLFYILLAIGHATGSSQSATVNKNLYEDTS